MVYTSCQDAALFPFCLKQTIALRGLGTVGVEQGEAERMIISSGGELMGRLINE